MTAVPFNAKTMELVQGEIEAEVTQAMQNMLAIVEAAGGDKSTILKTTVFVKDISLFGRINTTYEEVSCLSADVRRSRGGSEECLQSFQCHRDPHSHMHRSSHLTSQHAPSSRLLACPETSTLRSNALRRPSKLLSARIPRGIMAPTVFFCCIMSIP